MTADQAPDAPGRTIIRRLVPGDWELSRRVRLAALAEAPYAFMSTLGRELGFDDQVWRERLGLATAATFLAWQDGEPAGTATGKAEDPDDEFAVPGAWQLVGMWVDPLARGAGVADALIEAVAGHAADRGAPALVLWVTEVNDRARAFYQRVGFSRTGARQPVRPTEPDHWEEQMIRQLR
jgi:ribosomal protein S18 acetylase RimI-like enzyme